MQFSLVPGPKPLVILVIDIIGHVRSVVASDFDAHHTIFFSSAASGGPLPIESKGDAHSIREFSLSLASFLYSRPSRKDRDASEQCAPPPLRLSRVGRVAILRTFV